MLSSSLGLSVYEELTMISAWPDNCMVRILFSFHDNLRAIGCARTHMQMIFFYFFNVNLALSWECEIRSEEQTNECR